MNRFRTSNIDFSKPPDTQLAREQSAKAKTLDDDLIARLNERAGIAPHTEGISGGISRAEVGPHKGIRGQGLSAPPRPLASPGAIRPFTFDAERRPIPGFSGYSITREGDVYSAKGRLDRSEKSGKGRVQMRADDGSYTSRTIERLLAEIWP